MKTTLIIPTLNEIDGVREIFPRIKRKWVSEILVVDGGSTDGTVEYLKSRKYKILFQDVKGYGAGIRYALDRSKGDVIIEFTSDGSSLPEKIPEIIRKINEGYDLVIASRYKEGAKSYDDDFLTGFGNRFFTFLTNVFFGSCYTDSLVGFRAYRRSAFDKLVMDAPGLVWPLQSSIQFFRHGFRVAEIQADEPKRIGGGRKMQPFRTGLNILTLLLNERARKCSTTRQ